MGRDALNPSTEAAPGVSSSMLGAWSAPTLDLQEPDQLEAAELPPVGMMGACAACYPHGLEMHLCRLSLSGARHPCCPHRTALQVKQILLGGYVCVPPICQSHSSEAPELLPQRFCQYADLPAQTGARDAGTPVALDSLKDTLARLRLGLSRYLPGASALC